MLDHTLRIRTARTAAAAGILGIGLAGVLAGCSTATTTTGGGSGSDGSGSGGSGTSSSSGTYKDGTYTGTGSYQSPGGQESIDVKVTLADSKVTEITVTPKASGGNAERYQTAFAKGISGEVVGKRIDGLDGVSRVSGSSLTSGGFQKAIADIESQAKA